ncbi:MAG: 1-acyl-sn-glycerol-3-phosphate acyltransferase [Zoogloeaceae bacterium]|jgi:1-acyl-sn-glycerol-3-phosphate acyltransferase|nr:1-acyl-sn-glycerol-3-phosphate acyltransferase [Zoogloeaceae bacterium]
MLTRLFWRAERFQRVLATGFCFALFGFGGLLVLCLLFPALRLMYFDIAASRRMARKIICQCLRFFVRVMILTRCISVEVRQRERLAREGILIVANHPSLIDVVLLIALLRRPNCIVKSRLRDNVFTRGPVLSAGFVINDNGQQLVADCLASLRSGDSMIIFPEGTRSPSHDSLYPFKRGAANIAVRGGQMLTPVLITVSQPMLGKGMAWYQAPFRKPHFILDVREDWLPPAVSESGAEGAQARAARALSLQLHSFFLKELRASCKH